LCFRVKKFTKPSDWTKHVHEDVQPFTCTYQNCREPKSFKRKADWVRHENERHRHLEWWTCQVDDCTHRCFRKDNFLQHLVREHKYPEPKAKSKAAVKKARGTDEAIWQMVRNCHHETNNKPQEEPCKFCGKTLASWKKLTVHLAKHMEQISLPVLRIVKEQQVDANTIISPVEPLIVRQPPPTPMNREASGSSAQYSHTISPNVPSTSQFSPMYNPSSAVSTMPLFQEGIFGHQPVFGIQASMQQNQPPELLYGTGSMQYTNPQTQGFTPMDQSPLIDHAQTFTSGNQLYPNIPHQQGYTSYPSSTHTLSPEHTPFVSATPHFPSFTPQSQSLNPDGSPFQQNLFGFTGLNVQQESGSGFASTQMQQHTMGRSQSQGGTGNNTYPPSSQGGYSGYQG